MYYIQSHNMCLYLLDILFVIARDLTSIFGFIVFFLLLLLCVCACVCVSSFYSCTRQCLGIRIYKQLNEFLNNFKLKGNLFLINLNFMDYDCCFHLVLAKVFFRDKRTLFPRWGIQVKLSFLTHLTWADLDALVHWSVFYRSACRQAQYIGMNSGNGWLLLVARHG